MNNKLPNAANSQSSFEKTDNDEQLNDPNRIDSVAGDPQQARNGGRVQNATTRRRPSYATVDCARRERIIQAFSNGQSGTSIASYENLPKSTIYSILDLYKKTGRATSSPRGGLRKEKMTNEIKEFVSQNVDENCTLSLKRITTLIMDRFGVSVSTTTVFNCLKSLNYSLKSLKLIPQRRNAGDVLNTRKTYSEEFQRIEESYPPNKIIFLDEVGFNISLRIRHGRAPIGVTPTTIVSNIRSKNISVCCAMTRCGMLYKKVSDRPYNALIFNEYLMSIFEQLRNNELRNCIFIMDNVAFHKCVSIRTTLETEGHRVMYLPPYSPSLNPIEEAFSKWKTIVKRANCRDLQELMAVIRSGWNEITVEDCDGFYRHMKRELRNAEEEIPFT